MWIFVLLVFAAFLALMFVPALKGYRTLVFNYIAGAVMAVLPIANDMFGYFQSVDWRQYLDAKYAPWMILGVVVVGIMLRHATKGPVGDK